MYVRDETSVGVEITHRDSWTIFDVLGVTSCLIGMAIVVFIVSAIFIGNENIMLIVFRYVMSLMGIFIPILWIKKRYGLFKEALGLTKGHLSLTALVILGVIPAVVYSILIRLSPLWYLWGQTPLPVNEISNYYLYLILLPISVVGFVMFVLGPIAEEVMHRGLIYGYFRVKFGVFFAIILQAFIFSLSHIGFIYGGKALYFTLSYFVAGILFGILYEKSGSLYPSMICHGMSNFLLTILAFGLM